MHVLLNWRACAWLAAVAIWLVSVSAARADYHVVEELPPPPTFSPSTVEVGEETSVSGDVPPHFGASTLQYSGGLLGPHDIDLFPGEFDWGKITIPVMAAGVFYVSIQSISQPTLFTDSAPLTVRPRKNECDITREPRGGFYGALATLGCDRHHMPSQASLRGSGYFPNCMPAIRMTYEDHRVTASHGQRGADARQFRNDQARLVQKGNLQAAFDMDVADIRDKFQTKYEPAIAQAQIALNLAGQQLCLLTA